MSAELMTIEARARVHAALGDPGRLAIVDFIPEQSPHRTEPALTVSEAQTEAWLQAAGLRLAEKVTLFDDRFYVIYSKP